MRSPRESNLRWTLVILSSAFVLRFAGIWYGLPAELNSDEPFNLISALSYGAKKSLQPTYFVYPSLYSYFLFFIYGVYFVVGKLLGLWQSALDFGAAYFLNPSGLFLVGRFTSVILGTAAVAVVYRIGARFFSRPIGWLAAGCLALSYTHADLSHWILLEAALVFLCGLAVFYILKFNEQPSLRANCVAGLICGLVLSTKYNAGFVVLPLALAIFLNFKSEPKRLLLHLGMAALLFAAGFFIGTPYWILSFSEFWETLRYTLGHVSEGMSGHVSAMPLVWPLWELIFRDWSVGLVLVAGVIYGLFQRQRKTWLLLAFALPTLLVVGAWNRTGIHYIAPVYPALALLAAFFLNDILALIKNQPLRAAVILILSVPAAVKIVYQDFRLTQKDSRTVAQEWIESHVPVGSAVAYENYVYGPNLFDPARFLENASESALLPVELRERLLHERNFRPYFNLVNLRKEFRRAGDAAAGAFNQPNAYLRQLWETRLPKLEAVKAAGVEYIVTSSDNYRRYFVGPPPKPGTALWFSYQNGRRFYESVFNSEEWILLKEFRPSFWSLGPVVRVYKLGSAK